MPIKPTDITGQRFGKWTVIEPVRVENKENSLRWKCRCDCGFERLHTTDGVKKSARCFNCHIKSNQQKRRGSGKHGLGRTSSGRGYVMLALREFPEVQALYPEKTRLYEHVAVMSLHLKRPLYDDESVHHKNGIRSDNTFGNLELRAAYHGQGQSVNDLLQWAKELIGRYGGESVPTSR